MFRSIENLPLGTIGVKAAGRVTRADQHEMLEPAIAAGLAKDGRLRLLYVQGTTFTGYELDAAFDDVVFGTRHFADFERIAFVSQSDRQNSAVRTIAGLMPADLRLFGMTEIE